MEADKTFCEQEIRLRACDVDLRGCWRPAAMFSAMQELAEEHSALLGYSRQSMIERGVVWVLVRVRLELVRPPCLGDAVRLRTWPGTASRALFPRYFSFSVGGEALGCASTQWMLVDTQSHRMALPADCGVFVESGGDPPVDAPQRLRYALSPDRVAERVVCYSDLDLNRHMNNARYIEWALDLFEPARYENSAVKTLQVNYVSEAKPGERVRMELSEQESEFSMRYVRADGSVVFEAAGSWTK